jgi:hypothetical protein
MNTQEIPVAGYRMRLGSPLAGLLIFVTTLIVASFFVCRTNWGSVTIRSVAKR